MMPVEQANVIFERSLVSLMAHTIRAMTNHFLDRGIELDVRVIADTANAIHLTAPNQGATSLLRTRLRRGTQPQERDRVIASIYIHKDANKHLARICIAHELYHLLLEMDEYLNGGRTAWAQIPTSKEVEDQCNQFAWQLCKYHNLFNEDENLRKQHVYFPPGIFKTALNTSNTGNAMEWPEGIALNPACSFTSVVPPAWIEKPK
jgi:hypothetical protein